MMPLHSLNTGDHPQGGSPDPSPFNILSLYKGYLYPTAVLSCTVAVDRKE